MLPQPPLDSATNIFQPNREEYAASFLQTLPRPLSPFHSYFRSHLQHTHPSNNITETTQAALRSHFDVQHAASPSQPPRTPTPTPQQTPPTIRDVQTLLNIVNENPPLHSTVNESSELAPAPTHSTPSPRATQPLSSSSQTQQPGEAGPVLPKHVFRDKQKRPSSGPSRSRQTLTPDMKRQRHNHSEQTRRDHLASQYTLLAALVGPHNSTADATLPTSGRPSRLKPDYKKSGIIQAAVKHIQIAEEQISALRERIKELETTLEHTRLSRHDAATVN